MFYQNSLYALHEAGISSKIENIVHEELLPKEDEDLKCVGIIQISSILLTLTIAIIVALFILMCEFLFKKKSAEAICL